MSRQSRGKRNELIRRDLGRIRQAEDGLFRGHVVFTCEPYSAARSLAPRRNTDAHPFYPFMVAKEVEIKFLKPSAAEITVHYEGILNEDDDEASSPPEVDYRPSMREVPITEHPKFDEWAGTPDEPIEGVFDPRTGAFLGWKPDSDLFMVDSFLYPGMTASVTEIERSEPDLSTLGARERKPDYLISAGTNREWMLIGLPHRSFKDFESGRELWSVTREYLLSNPGKFNARIYDNLP